jgi:hypothetical protein
VRLVVIESPYAGDVERNVAYARAAMRDCLMRGEAPLASHLLYTQPSVLKDEISEERHLGIAAGLAWGRLAEATVVYVDLGLTVGMEQGMADARLVGRPIERRSLPSWVSSKGATQKEQMDFSEALKAMKNGSRAARTGWNGKGMWIEIQSPDENSKMTLPYIFMKTAQGDLVPWLASQTDLLAGDWQLLPR